MATVNDVYAVTVENQRRIDATPEKVWQRTVSRTKPDGTRIQVTAIQELADTKTNVLALRSEVEALHALVETLRRYVVDTHPNPYGG